jgi:hypothetical protein
MELKSVPVKMVLADVYDRIEFTDDTSLLK